MKHIKYFENIKEPEEGDYVNCEEEIIFDRSANKELIDFISNNVGKIYYVRDEKVTTRRYVVCFENVPEDIESRFDMREFGLLSRNYNEKEIVFFSENKKDVEIFIQTKKYNL